MENEERNRERDHALAMKEIELKVAQHESSSITSPLGSPQTPFDVSKNIRLVPPFSEKDIDKYFSHFERVATTLNWPLLLQCVLTGKAREVFSASPIDQAKQYDVVKTTILHVYELVPEADRQRFRDAKKLEH